MPSMGRTFEDLVAEADSVSVDGWDFSWLDGRATEQRPSWGYQRLISQRYATVSAALDLHTGGGEVLAGAAPFPPTMAAIETWPPNAALATKRLHPHGVVVVATRAASPLPFADEAFDLVTSRHPNAMDWAEIARVLRPGGTYLAQHVGPATVAELTEYFIGAQPESWARQHPDTQRAGAQAAGLQVVDMRMERLRPGVLRHRRRCLLPAQGDLDGAGLHGGALPRSAARAARPHRVRRAVRRARHAGSGRSPQTRLITPRGATRPTRAAGRPGTG